MAQIAEILPEFLSPTGDLHARVDGVAKEVRTGTHPVGLALAPELAAKLAEEEAELADGEVPDNVPA